ncbi:efflux RND transporter periplasmic adaptor subunit [Pseudoalteromonas sp. T1lg65]|uniref:efflux RND transporter periplasmic adaptor subunit n=1 Tax=Pseudoalteromonas sp. T1lg65 TaxID=2077101 RepID=UPI003F7A3975
MQISKILISLCYIAYLLFSANVSASTPVTVSEVINASLQNEITVNGTLYGKKDVTLTAGISARLIFVAEPGQLVDEGDVLVKMDTLPLELARLRQQEMLKRAKVNLTLYQQELKRLTALAKTNSAAASQVDTVQNQHDLALSDIRLAELEIQVIDDQLNRATIRAPFSGVVSKRFKRAGREINRSDELITLADIHNLEVRLYVPVKYLKYLSKGTELAVASGSISFPDTTSAIVTAVIPTTDPRSQTVEVRASMPDSQANSWAIGQLIDVKVPLKSKDLALLIDRDALILRKTGTHIVKVDDNSVATIVPVAVGKGHGRLVEVTALDKAQLKAGDKVATRGAESLRTGQSVDVQ